MISLVIPGDPIPKLRPRFRKNGFTFDSQVQQKDACKWEIKHLLQHHYPTVSFPLKGPIDCEIYFFFKPTESWTKGVHNLISWHLYDHTNKPDLDNLIKFYLDCMTEIIYQDDRQIGRILTQKYYDKAPRTEIRIMGRSKTILEKVEDILSSLSAEEFGQLSSDLEIVADCVSTDYLGHSEEARLRTQLEAAYSLSIFADKYGAMLHNISKKYPGIWKQIDDFEKTIPAPESTEKFLNGFNGVCHPQKFMSEYTTQKGDTVKYYGV